MDNPTINLQFLPDRQGWNFYVPKDDRKATKKSIVAPNDLREIASKGFAVKCEVLEGKVK